MNVINSETSQSIIQHSIGLEKKTLLDYRRFIIIIII